MEYIPLLLIAYMLIAGLFYLAFAWSDDDVLADAGSMLMAIMWPVFIVTVLAMWAAGEFD